MIRKYRRIYLGALNLVDLIITKMFRGTSTDLDDCVAVFSTSEVNTAELLDRYSEAALYDINPEKKVMENFIVFVEQLAFRGLVNDDFLRKVRSCR